MTSADTGCGRKIGSTNHSPDHVRRRGHPALAGLAREPAQAVYATVWRAVHLSGHPPRSPIRLCLIAHRGDQRRVSFPRRRAIATISVEARIVCSSRFGAIPGRLSPPPPVPLRVTTAPSSSRFAADHVVTRSSGFVKVCENGRGRRARGSHRHPWRQADAPATGMAISDMPIRSRPGSVFTVEVSSKSPTPPLRKIMSPKATFGTPAISSFAPM